MTWLNELVPTIVLTGGPCAGKTSCLAYLNRELRDHGVTPVLLPEMARTLIKSGISPAQVPPELFQSRLMRAQMTLEDAAKELAANMKARRPVLICDRALMDSRAYLEPHQFASVLATNEWNIPHLRDRRYEAVIHLVTAADGAEAFYQQDDERLEPPELARERDLETRNAWVGHSHLRVVDNSTDMEGKLLRVLGIVLHTLGMPVPLEIERKFRVPLSVLDSLPGHSVRVSIEQGYLPRVRYGTQERIRKRGQDGEYVYYLTRKRELRSGVREELERQIGPEEYDLLSGRCVSYVRKDRWCFLYDNQYFELDDMRQVGKEFALLEIEFTEERQELHMPPWITEYQDVTDDPAYTNFKLAVART